MSGAAIPAPPPDASATVRGLVNTVAQTFAGDKTFNGKVVAGSAASIFDLSASTQTGALQLQNGAGINFSLADNDAYIIRSASNTLRIGGGVVSQLRVGAAVFGASSGNQGILVANAGARLALSNGGGNDYLTSDGANTISTPGNLSASTRINSGTKYQLGGFDALVLGGVSTNDSAIYGNVADGSSAVAVSVISNNVLSASGAKLFSVRNGVTEKASVDKDGMGRFAGGLGVGNSAAASALGTLSKKIQVFDAAGTSIGFVPVYTTIT